MWRGTAFNFEGRREKAIFSDEDLWSPQDVNSGRSLISQESPTPLDVNYDTSCDLCLYVYQHIYAARFPKIRKITIDTLSSTTTDALYNGRQ